MRRVGNVGRFNAKKPLHKNIELLAAAALLRKPGFDTIMDAMRKYREAGLDGSLRLSAKDFYDVNFGGSMARMRSDNRGHVIDVLHVI